MGTSITFARPDGKQASGYLASAGRANAPGVVVIQEWWGLQDQIKGICDRFALAGYDALAPGAGASPRFRQGRTRRATVGAPPVPHGPPRR